MNVSAAKTLGANEQSLGSLHISHNQHQKCTSETAYASTLICSATSNYFSSHENPYAQIDDQNYSDITPVYDRYDRVCIGKNKPCKIQTQSNLRNSEIVVHGLKAIQETGDNSFSNKPMNNKTTQATIETNISKA